MKLPSDFEANLAMDWRGSAVGTDWAPTPRRQYGWVHDVDGEYSTVTVDVRDASELVAYRDLAAWEAAYYARYEEIRDPEELTEFAYRRTWIDAQGRRTIEYARFIEEGCEPENRYVRVVEDGAYLIQVLLITEPGVSPKLVKAWLATFADEPLGTAPSKLGDRVFARIKLRGGC